MLLTKHVNTTVCPTALSESNDNRRAPSVPPPPQPNIRPPCTCVAMPTVSRTPLSTRKLRLLHKKTFRRLAEIGAFTDRPPTPNKHTMLVRGHYAIQNVSSMLQLRCLVRLDNTPYTKCHESSRSTSADSTSHIRRPAGSIVEQE